LGTGPNAFAGREGQRGRDPVLDLQLSGRVLAVSIHRARTNAQLPRNLLRVEVRMDQPEALALSLGQQRYGFGHAFHLRRSFDDEVSPAALSDTSQHTRRALCRRGRTIGKRFMGEGTPQRSDTHLRYSMIIMGRRGAPDRIPRVVVFLGHSGASDLERPAIVGGGFWSTLWATMTGRLRPILSVLLFGASTSC